MNVKIIFETYKKRKKKEEKNTTYYLILLIDQLPFHGIYFRQYRDQKVSEYDQEIAQSHTADQFMAP